MPRYTGHVNLSFSTGQIDDLRAGREQVFVDEMAAHLSALAPRHAQAMGPDAMRAFVRAAIDRSSAFGVLERDTTRVWLELSMLWGIGFADDLEPGDPVLGPGGPGDQAGGDGGPEAGERGCKTHVEFPFLPRLLSAAFSPARTRNLLRDGRLYPGSLKSY